MDIFKAAYGRLPITTRKWIARIVGAILVVAVTTQQWAPTVAPLVHLLPSWAQHAVNFVIALTLYLLRDQYAQEVESVIKAEG